MALLAAYNFDETSGNVVDHSGNSRDWTLNAGAQRTTGDGGHTDEGLTKLGAGMATVAATAFGQTTARTFMFWMKGQGNAVWWLRFYISADDTGSWGLYLLSGNLTLRLRKGGSNTNTAVAWSDDGLWHHYAGTYDGANARLYIDGTLVATSSSVTAPLDTADSIQVLETSLTTQTMDDLRFYDTALDQATIATLKDTPVGSAPPAFSGSVTLSAAAVLGTSGIRTSTGAVPLAASASAAAAGAKTGSGSMSASATAGLTVTGVRTSSSAVPLTAAGALSVAGVRGSTGTVSLASTAVLAAAGASARARAVMLSAMAALNAHKTVEAEPPPPERTYVVPAESRVLAVPAESRTVVA